VFVSMEPWNVVVPIPLSRGSARGFREVSMNHKGVEYTLKRSEPPGFWQWQFQIGELVRSGKIEARLALLAMRRVELRIDRELKHVTRQLTS
jgi:hypothetical protein